MARRPIHRRRFIPGAIITSLDELAREALRLEAVRWVYWSSLGRPFHPRVVACWQLSMVANLMARGVLRWAEINPDYRPGNEAPRMWHGKRAARSAFMFGR